MNFSLQKRMLVITFLVLLAGSIAALYYANRVSRKVITDEIGLYLAKEATTIKHFLEGWLDYATNDVMVWGSIPVFTDAVTETGYYGERALEESRRRLRELATEYKPFATAHIYRLDGSMAASSLSEQFLAGKPTNVSDRTYFQEASAGKTHISKIITSRYTGKKLFVIAAPIKREREIVGVVVGTVATKTLSLALKELGDLRKNTKIFLIDDNNYPIISSLTNPEDKKKVIAKSITIDNVVAFLQKNACWEERSQLLSERYCKDGQYIYVSSSLNINNWKIIEVNLIDQVESAARTMFKYSFLATALALLIVSLSLLIIYRKHIFLRLEHLQNNIQLLEKGELGSRMPTDHKNDEISSLANSFNKMATRLQESIESLSASRKQFQVAVDGSNDGIWDWDLVNDSVYLSSRWKNQLGYGSDELQNPTYDTVRKLFYEGDRKKMRDYLQRFLAGETKEKFDIEFRMHHKDGSLRWIRSRAAMLCDENGKPYRIAGAHTDTTEQHRIAEQLIKTKEEAETANRYKSEFLANMSHEIRTPIGFITGLCYMMRNTPLDTTQTDYIQKIEKSAESLLAIVNDILDFSKIEAGKLEIDLQSVDLHEILGFVVESFAAMAKEKGIGLRLHISPEIPHALQSDRLRLSQVFTNLVNNAIKFTTEGEVSIVASCLKNSGKSVDLEIVVCDTGIGMTKEQQKRIFNAFSQADASISRQFGGTGLGLVISRDLLELLGGTITVKSEQDKGTQFTINLQLACSDESAKKEETKEAPIASQKKSYPTAEATATSPARKITGAKVLLVEDNQINIMIAENLLAQLKITPDIAHNGKEAVEMVKERDYQLILMDVRMPVMGGYEAAREIRSLENEKYAKVPIIAMTANAMKQDIEEAMAAGMNDHLSKPIEPDTFYPLIQQWLER